MEFNYNIKVDSIPDRKYAKAYIEGRFAINQNGETIFTEDELLIAELAIEMLKWLKKGEYKSENFIYQTMDSDEESIFEFRHIEEGVVEFYSNWGNLNKTFSISLSELMRKMEIFVQSVEKELKEKFQLTLDNI